VCFPVPRLPRFEDTGRVNGSRTIKSGCFSGIRFFFKSPANIDHFYFLTSKTTTKPLHFLKSVLLQHAKRSLYFYQNFSKGLIMSTIPETKVSNHAHRTLDIEMKILAACVDGAIDPESDTGIGLQQQFYKVRDLVDQILKQ
jgi:hypothetical protein